MTSGFTFPYFFNYPPYFTLQPVKETRDKQVALWCSLILSFCQSTKTYIIDVQSESRLFSNDSINRKLSYEARAAILDELVAQGQAQCDVGPCSYSATRMCPAPWTFGVLPPQLSCRVGCAFDAVNCHGEAYGRAEWVDKSKTQCLIFWKRVEEWAAVLMDFVRTFGLSDSVMTMDELVGGDDVRGTELFGLHTEVLARVLRLLEAQGKVRTFKGSTAEEHGVKFL